MRTVGLTTDLTDDARTRMCAVRRVDWLAATADDRHTVDGAKSTRQDRAGGGEPIDKRKGKTSESRRSAEPGVIYSRCVAGPPPRLQNAIRRRPPRRATFRRLFWHRARDHSPDVTADGAEAATARQPPPGDLNAVRKVA